MANKQVINHFSQYSPELKGPALEIGSLIDPSYQQEIVRDIHKKPVSPYIGIDIFPGEGVDYVVNICKDSELEKLPVSQFNIIHCHYVMEHVTDIFSMARNIEKLLAPGGVFMFSVPFAWRIHRIPIDMWRFTPQSIDYLFPNIKFDDSRSAFALRKGDKKFPLENYPELKMSRFFRILKRFVYKDFFSQRALLPETNIMMYGIKVEQPTYTYLNPKFV